jgi:putative membrane protein
MGELVSIPALLAARAHVGADLSLALILLSAVMFTIGWRLAVHKRFNAHRWMQTASATLNAVVVCAWMIRSFVLYLVPAIPGKLGQRSYAVATTHAAVGVVALVLGVFVVLRGNELVPAALRFKKYKPIMRTSYALYMAGTVLGVLVYLVTYVRAFR